MDGHLGNKETLIDEIAYMIKVTKFGEDYLIGTFLTYKGKAWRLANLPPSGLSRVNPI